MYKLDMEKNEIVGVYFVWLLIHLSLLLIFSDGVFDNSNMGPEKFFPFNSAYDEEGLDKYDITEFLFYILSPLLIYGAYYFPNQEK